MFSCWEKSYAIYKIWLHDSQVTMRQDLDKDDYIPEPYQEASIETVHAMQKKEREERRTKEKGKRERLLAMGFEAEHSGEIIF